MLARPVLIFAGWSLLLSPLALGVDATAPHGRPLRVACLGDSITEGAGLPDPAADSYPAQLAALLGAGYEVRNFGVGGATLLAAGDKPYRRQPAYAAALAFAPDLVVIALGTNDSKPANWRHRADFLRDYTALLRELRALPSAPRLWICRPMPVTPSGDWEISPAVVAEELPPLLAQIAAEEHTGLIDLFTPLRAHPDYAPDLVHPDARGAGVIARTVAAALTAAR